MIMLNYTFIRNSKSLREVDPKLKYLNVLIGPNNSGKSLAMQALTLLRQSL